MADLIDRSKLKLATFRDDDGEMACYVQEIMEAPTVDAAEVVRCKDCKHYHPGTVYKEMKFCNRQKRGDNLPAHSRMRDDDFCSYGERREG
jgi:hypothetical protein